MGRRPLARRQADGGDRRAADERRPFRNGVRPELPNALLLLITGSGCLKGNIAAQVGHLYALDDVSRRTRAFTIFSTGINVGATLGPIVCGLLAQLLRLAYRLRLRGRADAARDRTYLAGQRYLADQKPRKRDRAPTPRLTGAETADGAAPILVAAITVFQSVAYYQIYNVGLVWIETMSTLRQPSGAIPCPWFNSIDAFVSIIAVPPLVYSVGRQAKRGLEPSDVAKIGIGAGIAAASAGMIVLGIWLAGGGKG
jgi:POT family proton-dependent oligopeptide transporter